MEIVPIAYVNDIIDDWEYLIMTAKIERPISASIRLDLTTLPDELIRKKFRFGHEEIIKLVDLLKFPATHVLENGCRV